MNRHSFSLFLLPLLAFSCLLSPPAHAAKKKTYRIGHFSYAAQGSVSPGQAREMMEILRKSLKERLGIDSEIIVYSSESELKKLLAEGKIDVVPMDVDNFTFFPGTSFKPLPVISFTQDNQSRFRWCLWSSKKLKNMPLKSITGDSFLTYDYSNPLTFFALRKFFLDNGVDKPLWDIFGTFIKSPNSNSTFMALALEKADFAWEGQESDIVMKSLNSVLVEKTARKECSQPYARSVIVANGNVMDAKDYQNILAQFRIVAEHPEKFEELKRFMPLIRMAKWKLVVAPKIDFTAEQKLLDTGAARGWDREMAYIAGIMKDVPTGTPVHIDPPKKSFAQCKSECRKNKNPDPCIDKCMR